MGTGTAPWGLKNQLQNSVSCFCSIRPFFKLCLYFFPLIFHWHCAADGYIAGLMENSCIPSEVASFRRPGEWTSLLATLQVPTLEQINPFYVLTTKRPTDSLIYDGFITCPLSSVAAHGMSLYPLGTPWLLVTMFKAGFKLRPQMSSRSKILVINPSLQCFCVREGFYFNSLCLNVLF